MIPIGSIIIWSGTLDNIPIGWHLCDGDDGTIDLRNRFVQGAWELRPVGERGGANDHVHTFNAGGHFHGAGETVDVAGAGIGEAWAGEEGSEETEVQGTTELADHRPFNVALAFIQKLF